MVKSTIRSILGYISAVLLLIILFITAIEMVAYVDKGFYEREYKKYDVLKAVNMNMEDVLYVTDEMMTYLRGSREDLVVNTVVNGEEREFFNDREKSHMADVRALFLKGLFLRRAALFLLAVCFLVLILLKTGLKMIMASLVLKVFLLFDMLAFIIVLLASRNFTRYFTIFHEMFFNNDLWLLDPDTDLLINILPEGFFVDIAIEILIVFLVLQSITVLLSLLWKGKKAK